MSTQFNSFNDLGPSELTPRTQIAPHHQAEPLERGHLQDQVILQDLIRRQDTPAPLDLRQQSDQLYPPAAQAPGILPSATFQVNEGSEKSRDDGRANPSLEMNDDATDLPALPASVATAHVPVLKSLDVGEQPVPSQRFQAVEYVLPSGSAFGMTTITMLLLFLLMLLAVIVLLLVRRLPSGKDQLIRLQMDGVPNPWSVLASREIANEPRMRRRGQKVGATLVRKQQTHVADLAIDGSLLNDLQMTLDDVWQAQEAERKQEEDAIVQALTEDNIALAKQLATVAS